jgi:arylsulfatase A-like enzyme
MNTSMRRLVLALSLGGLVSLPAPCPAPAADRPPNFVVIFADDLGYGDLGCYGHPTIRTPHLDRMAAEGIRFTQFYSAAEVCTPSRAALLTGRLPIRSGMCDDQKRVLFPQSAGGLPQTEITIARALKAKGYATGCIGKWHLGHLPAFLPTAHGFDSYFGIPYSNDMDRVPTAPKGRAAFLEPKSEYWNVPLLRDTREIERAPDQAQLTRRYTAEAVKFIQANRRKPFFLYFAHTFPHVPLFASKDFRGKSPRGLYGDTVEELDWSVGQVLDALRKEGLADDTLVFFSSDNGPWLIQLEQGGSAGLLRDGKGSTFEGGMRVPGIAWWPGRIKPGVNRDLASTMDIFNTCLALAGVPLPSDRQLDGVDLSGALLRGERVPRDTFFYYRGARLYAVRQGDFKAHFITQPGYGPGGPAEKNPPLLYNLQVDPGEQYDVAKAHPEIIERIIKVAEQHRATLTPAPSQLVETIKAN